MDFKYWSYPLGKIKSCKFFLNVFSETAEKISTGFPYTLKVYSEI